MTAAARVVEGATFFDAGLSGWADRIDLAVLDMAHQNRCILGQLFGRYALAPVDSDLNENRGFKAISAEDALQLDAEWRRVIADRRANETKETT